MGNDVRRKVVRNVYWAIAGKMVNLFSALVVGIIVARYLGPEQFGLMNYVISYVVLFQTLSAFGLDSIEIREISKQQFSTAQVLGSALAVRLVLSVIFFALVVFVSWQFDSDAYTTLLVFIYALTIPLNCLNVIRNYFTAIVQNEYVVKVEISRTIIAIAIKLILLWAGASLIWFVAFSMFDYVLTASGYVAAYRVKVGSIRCWNVDRTCTQFLLRESFPLLLTNAAVILYQRIDQVMIGQMIDKQSVGYFAVASRFTDVLIYIPMILSQTLMPVLVRVLKQDAERYRMRAQLFMNLSIWLSLLAAGVTSLCAYWLVTLLFGESYLPAVTVLQVMAFKAASVALSNTAGTMLVAEGLQRYAFWRDLLGCVACIVLNYLLLPQYGIVAAALVAIVSNIVAGYLADALIPDYRHLFVRQTRALLFGWRDLPQVRILFSRSVA